MTDDDPAALGGAPPKLTIGQRILTALPTLQRPAPPAPPPPPAARPGRPTQPPASKPGGAARPGKSSAGRADGVLVGETDHTADDSDDDRATDTDDGGATDTDDGGATDTDDGADAAAGATPRSGGRLGALLNPAAAGGRTRTVDNLDEMTREEITHRIKRLDDRERFLALTAAPFGVAVGVLLTVVAIHLNPSLMLHGKLNPKHVSDSLILARGRCAPPAVGGGGGVRADPPAVARRLRPALPGHADGLAAVRPAVLGLGGIPHLAGVQVPAGPDRPDAAARGTPARRRPRRSTKRMRTARQPPGGGARRRGRGTRARPGSARAPEGAGPDRASTVEALHPTPPDTAPSTGAAL